MAGYLARCLWVICLGIATCVKVVGEIPGVPLVPHPNFSILAQPYVSDWLLNGISRPYPEVRTLLCS